MNIFLLLIIGIPAIEIYVMIKVVQNIGALNTISLILLTAITGIYFAKIAGLNTLRSAIYKLYQNKNQIPHFEIISKATINAIMDLSVKFNKPIGNGIITCLNKKQALERADPTKRNKGGEAARAVLSVLGILKDESK